MSDQVEEIKNKVDIVSLIGEYLQLKKAGRNYKAPCPFHIEKTPSFMVSPELQIYKCFGCGASGDALQFLKEYEGMEFPEALRFLADKVGVKLVSFRPGVENEKEKLIKVNLLAGKFYHFVLLNHPAGKVALDYLTKERGLSLETIKTFELGFSPTVPNVLKRFLVEKKKIDIRDVEAAGLGYPKAGAFIDKFSGRIIFPLFDHRGNVVGFAGRILPSSGNQDTAKYINSPETLVYHKSRLLYGLNLVKSEIKAKGDAVVVEGELDMISSWQAGIKNTVAIKGSALTEDQIRPLSRFCKKIILSLDADIAGDLAARRGIVIAQKGGLEIKVARLKDYKDPDEAVRKDPKAYKAALTEAVGVWDFVIDSVFSRVGGSGGEDKAKISREIVPILASIPDKIVQAHYIGIVASKLEVPEEAVGEQVLSVTEETAKTGEVMLKYTPLAKSRRQLLEERLLSLAFVDDPKFLLNKKVSLLVKTPLTKRLVQEYLSYSSKQKTFDISLFAKGLPKELDQGFSELVLKEVEYPAGDRDFLAQEINLVLYELEVIDIRHRLESIGAKIRDYEEKGEKDKLKEVQEKFGLLSERLAKLEGKERGSIILQEQ